MSSIFKFAGAQSPPRRLLIHPSPTSPFCTSPSQLQEVTLDPDSTTFTYMGMRSPNAAGGRSVKEFEEQLTNLRKENFNLKLRIYFLEERMGANFNVDKENAMKKNIELSVEVEALRKEVEEKQELLCQAVKAMELEEEEHKKDVVVRDIEIQSLKEELQNIKQNAQVAFQSNSNLTAGNQLTLYAAHLQLDNSKASDILHDLHNQIKESEKQLKKERNRGDHLERLLAAADCESTKSKDLELEIRRKENKLLSVEEELKESTYKICTFESRFQDLEEQLSIIKTELDNKIKELKKKEQELSVKDNQMEELKRALLDAENQMDMEQRKAEKYRTSLSKRNTILSEKDMYIEKLETKIRHLESCLNEVNQQSNEMSLTNQMQKSKSNNNDVDSFSVHSPSASPEFSTKKNSPQLTTPHKLQKALSAPQNSPTPSYHGNPLQHSASLGENITQFSQTSTMSPNNIEFNVHLLEELKEDLNKSKEEIARLKQDQYKAIKIIKSMILTRKEHTQEIEHLKAVISEREQMVNDLKAKIADLESCPIQLEKPSKNKKSLHQKVSEMNLTATLSPTANNENSMAEAGEGQQLCEQYKTLSVELEKQVQVLLETLKEKDAQLESLKVECEKNLSDLKAKQNYIIDLEFELLSNENRNMSDGNVEEKFDIASEKDSSFWKKELMGKDKEIIRLESELRKRTGDLQTIVNKELWEKNREIEKLQKRYGNALEIKEKQIVDLKRDIEGKDLQLSVLKDKINELGIQLNLSSDLLPVRDSCKSFAFDGNKSIEECLNIRIEERKYLIQQIEDLKLQIKNTPEKDESNELQRLNTELNNVQQELERSEKLRLESQDICSILSTRLEELCQFLDSLLKQKSVLGFLGSKQKSRLRKIIDQSLDLSRTLSMNISLNPNQSLLQLSNLSNLLDLTQNNTNDVITNEEESSLSILSDEISLTYQSHLKFSKSDHVISSNVVAQQAEVIKILREQVENLKKEIEVRDVELGNRLMVNEYCHQRVLNNDQDFVEAVMDLQSTLSESPKQASSPQRILKDLHVHKSHFAANEKSGLNTTSTTLKNINTENQSESECWSEPDRMVSMQRMGIIDEKLKPGLNSSISSRRSRFSNSVCLSTESTEDEQNTSFSRLYSRKSFSENRQTIASLQEQIYELESKLKDKENQLLAAQIAYFETEKTLKQERVKLEEFAKQEQELTLKIKETERKLIEAEEKEKEANKKLSEYKNIITTLEDFKTNMEKQMTTKDKEMQNRINELEKEKEKALCTAKIAETTANEAKENVKIAESKLMDLQEKQKIIQNETRKIIEEEYKIKLKNSENELQNRMKEKEEEYKTKLENVEQERESQIGMIKESINDIKLYCEGDYLKKTDVENQGLAVQFILNELDFIKKAIKMANTKIKEMEENEIMYKHKMHKLENQNEEKLKSLYEQLDNIALQHSETMLDKTKLINERNVLEQEVQRYREREGELVKQVNEFQEEFSDIKYNFQKQLTYLENLKFSLENKVSQLETSNAELRKKIMNFGDHHHHHSSCSLSFSLPNSPSKHMDLYPNKTLPIPSKKSSKSYCRQFSDSAPSSDDVASKPTFNLLHLQAQSIANVEQETHIGTSSPDLGIESDQGRFSSLEANINIPRPLLPTLELTESMSNLLDCDNLAVQENMCSNEDCLKKIKGVINENSDLKRRLLRTRRALEETVTQLTLANRRKKEVEKTICRQIHKTSQVLRKAKANLDSGSETEILKK